MRTLIPQKAPNPRLSKMQNPITFTSRFQRRIACATLLISLGLGLSACESTSSEEPAPQPANTSTREEPAKDEREEPAAKTSPDAHAETPGKDDKASPDAPAEVKVKVKDDTTASNTGGDDSSTTKAEDKTGSDNPKGDKEEKLPTAFELQQQLTAREKELDQLKLQLQQSKDREAELRKERDLARTRTKELDTKLVEERVRSSTLLDRTRELRVRVLRVREEAGLAASGLTAEEAAERAHVVLDELLAYLKRVEGDLNKEEALALFTELATLAPVAFASYQTGYTELLKRFGPISGDLPRTMRLSTEEVEALMTDEALRYALSPREDDQVEASLKIAALTRLPERLSIPVEERCELLANNLRFDDRRVRTLSVTQLGKIEDGAALPYLRDLLEWDEATVWERDLAARGIVAIANNANLEEASKEAKRIAEDLRFHPNPEIARAIRKALGEKQPEPPAVRYLTHAPSDGILITHVEQLSRCARAGFLPGDLLTKADDEKITSLETFDAMLKARAADQPLTVELTREGRSVTLLLEAGSFDAKAQWVLKGKKEGEDEEDQAEDKPADEAEDTKD